MDHINIIRLGTKMLAFNPHRILNDPSFLDMINEFSLSEKKIYIMSHFSHPNEITPEAIRAVNLILKAGAIIANQTPMIVGVNDSVDTMVRLFEKLSFIGIPPYYIFGCRPTAGNKAYSVPVEKAYVIFEKARSKVSGLAARARFVMSHKSGKIEVCAITNKTIAFRYHRAAKLEDKNKFLVCKRNPEGYWFDDYTEILEEYTL
jgi:L-lysine 2,3-aminomutase